MQMEAVVPAAKTIVGEIFASVQRSPVGSPEEKENWVAFEDE